MKELAVRLNGRATDDDETIKLRLDTAESEIKCVYDYDYAVVNENLNDCVSKIKNIIISEKSRVKRQDEIIKKLLNGGTIL